MKAILSMALVLGLCGLARAADDKVVDPVGTWKCEYEIGGEQWTSTLKINKDNDKFTGTMSWPEQEDEKLKDLKLKDGKLTFSAVRKFMDNEIPIDDSFTIDEDKLKGKGEAEFGGEKREFDIEGKREKKDKSSREPRSSEGGETKRQNQKTRARWPMMNISAIELASSGGSLTKPIPHPSSRCTSLNLAGMSISCTQAGRQSPQPTQEVPFFVTAA